MFFDEIKARFLGEVLYPSLKQVCFVLLHLGSISPTFYVQICTSRFTPIRAYSVEVECIFLLGVMMKLGLILLVKGETEWRLRVPKNNSWRICALRQNVDEIDPLSFSYCDTIMQFFPLN